jgi:hypothetical protein
MNKRKDSLSVIKTKEQLNQIQRSIESITKKKVKESENIFVGLSRLERRHKIIFSLVIAIAIILFWRGIWNLADEYLIPEDFVFSNLLSIILALAILGASEYLIRYLAGT